MAKRSLFKPGDAPYLARSAAPLPHLLEMSDSAALDPQLITNALRRLSELTLDLRAAAEESDCDAFLVAFGRARKLSRTLEPAVQSLRYRWATACRGRLATDIEFRGKHYSSGHLCLYELCRERLMTVWGAADIKKLASALTGEPVEWNADVIRQNWATVRRIVVDAACFEAEDLLPQIDAELGAMQQDTPLTVEGSRTLPVVRWESDPPEIEYNGKVFIVEHDHALAFKAMLEAQPDRVGLTKVLGPHPERKLKQLPAELRALIDTTNKGSRLII